LNVDFDDIAGNFSQGTVQTNRMMNETVGGMEMLSGQANAQMEYMVRVFAETWIEPVLMQLVRLEQYYETDDTILTVATNKAEQDSNQQGGEFQRFGAEEMDELLRYEMTVGVNVGIGATDPIRKIERLLLGIRTMGEINPDIVSLINQEEVTKEVFGALGYKDSKRFIAIQPQAKLEEMAAQLEELGGAVQQLMEQGSNKELDVQGKIVSAQIKGQSDVAAAEAKALGEMRTAQLQVAAMNERDAVKAQLHMINSDIRLIHQHLVN